MTRHRTILLNLWLFSWAVSCVDLPESDPEDGGTGVTIPTETAPAGACEGISCWDPPPNVCADTGAGLMTVFAPNGFCAGGECNYPSKETICPSGICEAGECQEQPCHGLICNHSPEASCASENATRRYSQNGYCATGACQYASKEDSCGDGLCTDGVCVNSPPVSL